METRKVASACQGGGIHGAFTCGVLTAILEAKEQEAHGNLAAGARRSFDIIGLSGTSAGALNAFMVWYGMMAKGDRPGSFAEARRALNQLWDTFQGQKRSEEGVNTLAQQFYKLQELGVIIKQPLPAHFYDWLMSALSQWSAIENAVAPNMDLGEIRPEFYDFLKLLQTCAPQFASIHSRLDEIARNKVTPRLLLGAVEILSGRFEAFDSTSSNRLPKRNRNTPRSRSSRSTSRSRSTSSRWPGTGPISASAPSSIAAPISSTACAGTGRSKDLRSCRCGFPIQQISSSGQRAMRWT